MRQCSLRQCSARHCSTLVRALSRDGELHCHFSDGAAGRFHHSWLRDHCPQSRHPVSGQRTFELCDLPPGLAPRAVAIGNMQGVENMDSVAST